MSQSIQPSPTPVFSFQDHQVRTVVKDGQPWFVAKDVCRALGITWSGATNRAIPDDWRSLLKLNMEGLPLRTVSVISEPAVYKLAFRSNKKRAEAFTNWVASEVLPTIRKTGKYAVQAEPAPKQKALPKAKPKSLPPAHAEVDSLLGKVRFYIGEIADLEKRITGIMTEEYLRKNPEAPATMQDSRYAHNLYLASSAASLWQSIDFALKAIVESINMRLEKGA